MMVTIIKASLDSIQTLVKAVQTLEIEDKIYIWTAFIDV